MRLQLRIIGLLSKKQALTINQTAKELNETYSFVNRIIKEMINEGLIKKQKIGHSLLCSLNIKNDKTKALMALNEVDKKQEFLEKNKEIKLIAEEILREVKADSIAIFGSYAKNTQTKESDIDIFILAEEKADLTSLIRDVHSRYGREISPILLSKKQLKKQKDKPIIREIIKYHVVLTGFENFINLMVDNET